MTIKELQISCHKIAKEKGFWNDTEVDAGNGYNTSIPCNIPEKLMLIVTELSEACEALRNNNKQDVSKNWRKDTFEDELADVAIRLFDLAEAEGINLTYQIEQKLNYNKSRPPKHGKLF